MLCNRRIKAISAAWLIAVATFAGAQAKPPAKSPVRRPNPQNQQLVGDFEARVNQYLDMRKQKAGNPPRSNDSSQKLVQMQKEMAAKVRAARPAAKQGDIFTPPIADYFRKEIGATLSGSSGAKIRASLQHAEPVKGITLEVYGAYPDGVPLQSTPPTLLLNLPRLPKDVEYRIVGDQLVLHDVAANIVVDFIPHAIPSAQ